MATKKKAPAARKPAAKRSYRPGYMGRKEIQPLVLAAREAFDYQAALGNIDPGVSFDTWRRDQVLQTVNRKGLSDCLHDHFRPLMGHFKLLAGRDADALESFLSTGPTADHSAPGDDHETRRQLAHQILEALAAHIRLADISAVDLAAETPDTDTYQTLRARRAAILAHPQGALREGYLVHLARQKTRRPSLHLGPDLQAGLADRCTADQLAQIRSTLINRIAVREDRPPSEGGRNRKQRAAAGDHSRRSIHDLAPRIAAPENDPF
jgi:hypothetical protein